MPRVSVIVPAYRAQRTLPRCVASLLAQTFGDFEVIVSESGEEPSAKDDVPHDRRVRILNCPVRLAPHESSNRAAAMATGDLLAFVDADAYPRPDWLAQLVDAWEARGGAVMGGVACFGRRWIDRSAHLCKFDKWLPAGPPRPLTDAATVDLLIGRDLFESVGSFTATLFHADTDLSWRLRQAGHPLTLIPSAVVEHHHLHGLMELWRERYSRGNGFAYLWTHWSRPTRLGFVWRIAKSILPLRLASQSVRVLRHAWRAGERWELLVTMPPAVAGLYAWLLGESAGYLHLLLAGP
ncbi:MAG TPA: glycosyltransferase [Anaerolineales bacterium]|nr:glycosyltransferase [Anaerolineales bacterium]